MHFGDRFVLLFSMAEVEVAEPKVAETPRSKPHQRVEKMPPFNVVLLDDDDHTYEYVIDMLQRVFAHSRSKGWQMAREVDTRGRVIVFTGHKELAELKRDQIHSFGRDQRILACRGAMRAVIEPAAI